jgi:hypothetical protein
MVLPWLWSCLSHSSPALFPAQTYYVEHYTPEPAARYACWAEYDVEQLGAVFTCGALDPLSPRWDWGGAATALSPLDALLEQLGAAWRAFAGALEQEGDTFGRSRWSHLEAVIAPGARTPLLVPPRSVPSPIFPTHTTMLHSTQAEARSTFQLLRSSAAREAFDQTYQHPLLSLINPSLAAQQLCSHGGYPAIICAIAKLCAGGWVSLLAAVLGRALTPGGFLLTTLATIELSRRLGPQSPVRRVPGVPFSSNPGYDSGLPNSGGPAFRVCSVNRREESAAGAVQSPKRGGCCHGTCCCRKEGECPQPEPAKEVHPNQSEAQSKVCPVRETDVPPTGASVRDPSQTWDNPTADAFEYSCPASVDAKCDDPDLATRTPTITCAGVNHRGGQDMNGLTAWLETCSLTPVLYVTSYFIQPLSDMYVFWASMMHLCCDPLSHFIHQQCFHAAFSKLSQPEQAHPTKQKGDAKSTTKQSKTLIITIIFFTKTAIVNPNNNPIQISIQNTIAIPIF